jgi:hypothetical protein
VHREICYLTWEDCQHFIDLILRAMDRGDRALLQVGREPRGSDEEVQDLSDTNEVPCGGRQEHDEVICIK